VQQNKAHIVRMIFYFKYIFALFSSQECSSCLLTDFISSNISLFTVLTTGWVESPQIYPYGNIWWLSERYLFEVRCPS